MIVVMPAPWPCEYCGGTGVLRFAPEGGVATTVDCSCGATPQPSEYVTIRCAVPAGGPLADLIEEDP
jgi:hypothetical protein